MRTDAEPRVHRAVARRTPVGLVAMLLLALAATGCAPIWSPINDGTPRPFEMPTHQMRMVLPTGWMSSSYGPMAGHFFFTRHGAELEEFWVRRFPKTAVVKGTGRNLAGALTIQDMAQISIDSRRLDEGTGAFEVTSNRPATIGGQDCFRLEYRHRNAIGLAKRVVEYGCSVGPWLYRFEYMAPEQHYFVRYLPDFESSVRTIEFTVPGV